MRICIIGGTGNISTPIVPLLLAAGHEVTLYNRGQSRAATIPKGVRVITGDRKDAAAFEAAIQREQFDAGIDMICFTPEEARSTLRAFRGPHLKHLIFTSTVCAYGVHYDWLPATEDHPLRPISNYGRNKAAAEAVFLEAMHREGLPVTIVRPSTTYGPIMGAPRQIAWDLSYVDRIRKGKPLVVCGDGNALHSFLHVDDAAMAYAAMMGRAVCIGQTYNLVPPNFMTWADHHRAAMRALGRDVELVGVPFADLVKVNVPGFFICNDIYAYHTIYSDAKLRRDVPEFCPRLTLEAGLKSVIESLDREGRIPDSDKLTWEDRLIEAQSGVGRLRLS